ncbi:MAG TPA: gliding motility lipoprotein GldD [Lutibacter sp.]|nr:gliding motility lipoprotein GldD [Lutibacter sp.]
MSKYTTIRVFLIIFLTINLSLFSCKDEVLPKPQSYLHLAYPVVEYHRFSNDCPFSFAISKDSHIVFETDCNAKIIYPKQNATVHFTYRRVQGNLKQILKEADQLTTKHTIKADAILPHTFENKENKVYGVLFDVQGQSASNVQFHITDSSKHVLTAALYFKVQPNYDSIFPAVEYIKNDMIKMMETLEWKD